MVAVECVIETQRMGTVSYDTTLSVQCVIRDEMRYEKKVTTTRCFVSGTLRWTHTACRKTFWTAALEMDVSSRV